VCRGLEGVPLLRSGRGGLSSSEKVLLLRSGRGAAKFLGEGSSEKVLLLRSGKGAVAKHSKELPGLKSRGIVITSGIG